MVENRLPRLPLAACTKPTVWGTPLLFMGYIGMCGPKGMIFRRFGHKQGIDLADFDQFGHK